MLYNITIDYGFAGAQETFDEVEFECAADADKHYWEHAEQSIDVTTNEEDDGTFSYTCNPGFCGCDLAGDGYETEDDAHNAGYEEVSSNISITIEEA